MLCPPGALPTAVLVPRVQTTNTARVHTGLLAPCQAEISLMWRQTEAPCGVLEGVGSGPGSLAGVVNLDLQVYGLKHIAHPGLQPVQLSRLVLQGALVLFVGALQF